MKEKIEISKLITEKELKSLIRKLPVTTKSIKNWLKKDVNVNVYRGALKFKKAFDGMPDDFKEYIIDQGRIAQPGEFLDEVDKNTLESFKELGIEFNVEDELDPSLFRNHLRKAEEYIEVYETQKSDLMELNSLFRKLMVVKEEILNEKA